jgi:hypothetical protein
LSHATGPQGDELAAQGDDAGNVGFDQVAGLFAR